MQTGSYLAQGHRAKEYCQSQGVLPTPGPGVWPCLHGIGPYREQPTGTELQEPSLENTVITCNQEAHRKPEQRLGTILKPQVIRA